MKNKKLPLKPYSVPITDELKDALKRLAAVERRPAANYVRMVLEQHAIEAGALKPSAAPTRS
jgi:predicted DNA-binding protein